MDNVVAQLPSAAENIAADQLQTLALNADAESKADGGALPADPESPNAARNQTYGILHKCFSEEASDVMIHFQIVRLEKQYYIWIGCNSAAFGNLYAAVPTRFDPQPSIAPLITKGGDNGGALIAQRLSKRTGCQIVLACSLPPDSASLEVLAEKRLLQEIRELESLKEPETRIQSNLESER